MLHLLREESISKVAADSDKLLEIPKRNVAANRPRGNEKVAEFDDSRDSRMPSNKLRLHPHLVTVTRQRCSRRSRRLSYLPACAAFELVVFGLALADGFAGMSITVILFPSIAGGRSTLPTSANF